MSAVCWVSQDERAHLAAVDAADAEDAAIERVADDAADELLTEAGELFLYITEDERTHGEPVRYYKAWRGTQLREGLTCEEIVEACIWAPAGADLRQAMHTLRERLRGIVHTDYAEAAEIVARRILKEQAE